MADIHLEGLNDRQRGAVRLEGNGVVTAGAGAGKTSVLAARYLDLCIRRGLMPDRILALTFTRKAAAEMFSRIHARLAESSDPAAARALSEFAEARITTIDSFCAGIVRGSAADYGYPPDFTVDDEACAEIARTQAMRFVLERKSEPGLRELLSCFRLETVACDFFASIASSLVRPSVDGADIFAPMRGRMREELARLAAENIAALDAAAEEIGRLAEGIDGPNADCQRAILAFKAWRESGRTRTAGASDWAARLRHAVDSSMAIGNLGFTSYGRSGAQIAVKNLAKAARAGPAALLPQLADTADFLPTYDLLMEHAADFAERVRKARRAASVMGFADLGACAVDILERRADIRTWWRRKIRSIMIDEFQDDNELQKRLLFLLAGRVDDTDTAQSGGAGAAGAAGLEPGKLFFVGDEKQSIYRFRGADVSVFRRLALELGDQGAGSDGPMSLPVNYRSAPDLVEFFNGLFPRVMAGARADHEARYEAMEAGSRNPGFGSRIEYRVMRRGTRPGKRDADTDRALAADVASYIAAAVRDGLPVRGGDGTPRPARHSDFAILIRTGSRQHRIETALRNRGIPFDASDPRGLFSEAAAFDLYSSLKLALDPDDRNAYAAVLRSPAVRLGPDAFVRVMTAGETPFAAGGAAASFGIKDTEAFGRGRALIEGIRDRADRLAHASLLEWIWHTGGFRLALASRVATRPFAEHFEFVRHLAAKADSEGLCAWEFVRTLEPLMGGYDRIEMDHVVRDTVDGVRIMTIHKSKGLEFPIVLVPGMESPGGGGGEAGPIWSLLPGIGVTVNLKAHDDPGAKSSNVFHRLASEEEKSKELAETKRLFYVACTRAADHLVFFGLEPERADNAGAAFHTLLAGGDGLRDQDSGQFVEPPPGLRIQDVDPDGVDAGETIRWTEAGGAAASTMAAFYRDAEPLERECPRPGVAATAIAALHHESHDAQASPAEASPPTPDRGAMRAPDFGTLCHDLIAYRIATAGENSSNPFVPEESLFQGCSSRERTEALTEAERLAGGFFASPLWARISRMERVESEKPFILDIGDAPLVEGRMDLFAETPAPGGGEIVIVDFKTDHARVMEIHALQLGIYRKAARALVPGAGVETHIFWLRHGESEECREGCPGSANDEYLRRLACSLR